MGVILPAACAVAAAGAFSTWAVRGRSSSVFGASVWHGPPTDPPSIALTFDDGPSESTGALLDILDRLHVRGTFFQCGVHVRRLPGVARQVAESGHEIGNHTDTHPHLYFKSASFVETEIERAQTAIADTTGKHPRLFRAPYGIRWFGLRAATQRFNLLGVMWTVIGRDWILPARAVADRVVSGAANGGIICLHDGRAVQANPDIAVTLDAVRSAIPLLVDRGYRFVTVSELLCLTQPDPLPPNPQPSA